jgi:hypothetical protein
MKHETHIDASLPQFTTNIPVQGFETLNIHFVHKRSEEKNAVPLLFVQNVGLVSDDYFWAGAHWLKGREPFGSAEDSASLDITIAGESPRFHVVTCSLPGYGFSQGSKKKGFSAKQYAEVGHRLMQTLDYDEYGGHRLLSLI